MPQTPRISGLHIRTARFEATRDFYAQLLGAAPEEEWQQDRVPIARFRLPGGLPLVIAGREERTGAGGGAAPPVALTFSVEDPDGYRAEAAGRGLALEAADEMTARLAESGGAACAGMTRDPAGTGVLVNRWNPPSALP